MTAPTPRPTRSWTTAMHRAADLLGWTLESSGRTWTVTEPVHDADLGPMSGTSRFLLAHMVTVALSPDGCGMEPAAVARALNLEIPQDRNGVVAWPNACSATEIAALAPLYRTAE